MDQISTIDYKSKNAGKTFVTSLCNTGFAVLYNHNIDNKLISKVYEEWGYFFSSSNKNDYLFDPEKQDGYFPFRSENAKNYSQKDLKEFFHYYEWGRYPKSISDNTKYIFNELLELGTKLLNFIDQYSPKNIKDQFSMPLSHMIQNSTTNLLRVIHYPPLNNMKTMGAIRAAAHEDINLITLLSPGSEPGLQILDNNNQWVDVQCDPKWLIINTGDMLKECSNKYFPSTTHRVINPQKNNLDKSRYTIPLFLHPRNDVILSKKHTAKSFLELRLREIGLK